jgi:Skp family chaperone for outer membrane proteins
LKQKYEKLNTEFAPRYQELQSMQTKMEAIQAQLEKASTLNAQQVRKLQEDGAALKKEYDRKTEDYQELARRREEQETGATYAKVNEVLNKFAAQHGLTLILEAGRAGEAGVIVYLNPKADITDAFMNEYNKANPVAAATPAPKNP